jgi:hypothetical protein
MFFITEHKVALETGETPIAVMGEKYEYKKNQSNLSDFIQPGPIMGGLSLIEDVPVNVGRKMTPVTLIVGTNEAGHRADATKHFKIV